MDQITQEQPVISPNSTPPSPAPQPAASGPAQSKPRHSPTKILVGVLAVLLMGSLVALSVTVMRLNQKQNVAFAPTPTPMPPTPTPVRVLSRFATESAFLRFETTVSSLSAVVSGYPIYDPSLSPPKLDLPLGFIN